ncbi:MAG: D-alanyl-D-alanine carboxypeptidase family protein [Ruminococcaceae bacterium]|nr:D-alanyl-D-alanine carboxypeptidase family protein [Oscillospiraceae bacterium]
MNNTGNNGRGSANRPANQPRVYGTYDIERAKARNARPVAPVHRQQGQHYDPRSRGNYPSGGYKQNQRRAPSTRNNKNDDKFLWVLIVLVAIMAVVAIVVLFNFIGGSDDGKPTGTEEQTAVTSPDESVEQTTPEQTEETEPEETTPPELLAPVPEFTADLTAYEMYMNPTGEHRDAYLILVNSKNPLPADYVPPNLTDVKSTRKDGRKTQQLQFYAAKALEALMLEADACGMVRTNTPSGYPLSVMSAYRTYEYQHQLFYDTYLVAEMKKGYSREEAEKIVETYSARPGTSEHQAGLCVDMHTLPGADQSFQYQPEAKWLAENCHKFGFILRFPEDKMEITGGIIYEPWHFRYVGRYHATRMKELGMCLEEYVAYLENNG